jgi:hypothetical protein
VLSVELHAHSSLSYDGRDPVELLLAQAQAVGLDALAVTDHDEIEASLRAVERAPEYGLVGIPGMEVSSGAGHVLALGVTEAVPPGLSFRKTLDRIREQGGIAVVPHPYQETRSGVLKNISEDELENEYFDNPSNAKDLAEEYSFLIAEAPLMPKIGQQLGQVFGPRNMMPDPMPPGSDPTDKIEDLRNTVTIRLKEDPLIQLKVGNEEQDLDEVARNASAVYEFIEGQLPQGHNNIKNILIKTTMGPSVEVDN